MISRNHILVYAHAIWGKSHKFGQSHAQEHSACSQAVLLVLNVVALVQITGLSKRCCLQNNASFNTLAALNLQFKKKI